MTDYTKQAWDWIEQQSSFTIAELVEATGINTKVCTSIVQGLRVRGQVKSTAYKTPARFKGGFQPIRYKVVKRTKPAGRGTSRAPKHRHGTGQQRVWQSMRILCKFTYPDLASTADVSMSTARVYCNFLMDFGYVTRIKTRPLNVANELRVGQCSRYVLVNNTGPVAPKRQGKNLFDANLKKEIKHEVA